MIFENDVLIICSRSVQPKKKKIGVDQLNCDGYITTD